jgi:hypothetical protein
LAVFPDVVEISNNLASDVVGVAGHTAPESADAGIPAPDLVPANAGEVVETRPQVGRFAIEPMYYDFLVSAGVTVYVQTKPV